MREHRHAHCCFGLSDTIGVAIVSVDRPREGAVDLLCHTRNANFVAVETGCRQRGADPTTKRSFADIAAHLRVAVGVTRGVRSP